MIPALTRGEERLLEIAIEDLKVFISDHFHNSDVQKLDYLEVKMAIGRLFIQAKERKHAPG